MDLEQTEFGVKARLPGVLPRHLSQFHLPYEQIRHEFQVDLLVDRALVVIYIIYYELIPIELLHLSISNLSPLPKYV